MTPKKIFSVSSLLCILLICAEKVSAQYDDRPRLISFEKARFEAMTKHDTLALNRLLATDLTYIFPSGVIDDKRSFMRDIGTGFIEYVYIIPEKVTATVDGNYGWIYGRANVRFKLARMAGTIDQYISFTDMYRLKYNQWQLVMCHNARIESNAPYIHNYEPQAKGSIQPNIY